jgi:hypothetical protein
MLVQLRFESVDDFVAQYATNVSLSGMFIATPLVYEIGAMLTLQFVQGDGDAFIEGLARVVHCRQGAGIGVEFVNLDEDSMRLIEHMVESALA